MRDVVVVGGGPGGLYSAWMLSSRGFHVTLTEEHATAGHPVHCTGIMTPEAFREFCIPEDSILNELRTARFISPSGQEFEYTPPRVEAVVVDRARFDKTLYCMAENAGVEMRTSCKVSNIEIDSDGVRVHAEGSTEPVRARACILATGANYSLHRQLKLDFPPLHLNSAQAEIPVTGNGTVEIYFGSEVAPQGFAWVAPVYRDSGRYARVGVMCATNAETAFKNFLSRVAQRWGIEKSELVVPRKRMLPLAPIARTYGERLLAVGDAAGLVKPTTGGGIYFSVLSAALAGELMAEALSENNLSAAMLSRYEERWRERLGSEMEAQKLLRHASARLSDMEIDQLFDLARTNGLVALIRKTARFNQHYDLIRSLFQHPGTRKILFRQMVTPSI
jgi:geranylgeranyl reductase family protein